MFNKIINFYKVTFESVDNTDRIIPTGDEFIVIMSICVAIMLIIFWLAIIISDISSLIKKDDTTSFKDFLNHKEYRLYHIIVLLIFMLPWIFEVILIVISLIIYKVFNYIYNIVVLIFNIKIYTK